ncbi:MAG: hypothetical protein ACT4PJ_06505 [Gemmatimonadaceae bacterium]
MPTRAEILSATARPIGGVVKVVSAILAVIGALVFLVGAFQGENRAWQALHVNWLFFASISQAAIAFVAVQRITTARWSRPIVRFLEGYVAFLPVAFLLLVLIFAGRHHIFPWTHEAPPVPEKAAWFDPTFIIARDLVTFGILVLLSVWYVYTSVRLDVGQAEDAGARWARGLRARMRRRFAEERLEIHATHSRQGWLAVVLCLAFGLFMSLLSWDLSMTLDMHFQSTLYSWWFFMGAWLGAITSWSLLTMWWRRHLDAYDLITEHHFHDLGKLSFAFTAFWGYLTFGQYLVIWYGNMGEETHWARLRLIAPWLKFTMPVVFLMFVLPFFGLLSRKAKVVLPVFAFFALASLVGLWLLRYVEVYPSLHYESPSAPMGMYEIGVTLGYLGLWGLCYAAFMDAFPRLRVTLLTSPYRDQVQVPYDPESLETLPAHE